MRGVGLSNYGPKSLRRAHRRLSDRGIEIASLQVQCSLLSTAPVDPGGVKEVCDELGIALIAYSPLTLGVLTGKYTEGGKLPSGLRGWLFRYLLPGIRPLLGCLDEMARSRGKTCAQVALNWCASKGTIPIPGAKSPQQAEENIGALGWQLTDSEVEALDRAARSVDRRMIQNIFQTA